MIARNVIKIGDCLESLRRMGDQSVHCVVTSPPYYGLRDYGHDGQIGLEQTPEAYIDRLCGVFDEVWRVLRDDGTLWLNIGDSYSSGQIGRNDSVQQQQINGRAVTSKITSSKSVNRAEGIGPKNLLMIPARVALEMQSRGWYLRSEIIWHKPNPMPESVTDRPTKSHEMVYLLSKQPRYWYDADAVREVSTNEARVITLGDKSFARGQQNGRGDAYYHGNAKNDAYVVPQYRNLRDVWTISTQPYSGAHFAVMPPELARKAIKAGCPAGGVVLDPFGGAGTTAVVAIEEGRDYVLCELNARYAGLALERIKDTRRIMQNADPFQTKVYADGTKQLSMFSEVI